MGKRCAEDFLLRGLEKHVLPLINLDKPLAEELGLGGCGWMRVVEVERDARRDGGGMNGWVC